MIAREYPGSVPLLIRGIPAIRYDLARQDRRRWRDAEAALGPNLIAPCFFELVDKLGERPPLRVYFDRGKVGYRQPEELFDPVLMDERIPGTQFEVRPSGQPAYWVRGHFRHSLHFGKLSVYEPHTQAELDAMARRREERRAARDLAKAPLFAVERST